MCSPMSHTAVHGLQEVRVCAVAVWKVPVGQVGHVGEVDAEHKPVMYCPDAHSVTHAAHAVWPI